MNTIHALTVRTTAALGRLGELQRRAEKLAAPSPVVRSTLKELTDALEELQVANQQLREHNDELEATRRSSIEVEARFDEFVNAIPCVCLWTDHQGVIQAANEAAATLLNVAANRLSGKPLSLFFTERQRFFEALGALAAPDGGAADLDLVVRPRERRPQRVRVTARRLAHDPRWCWFLSVHSERRVATEGLSGLREAAASSGPASSEA